MIDIQKKSPKKGSKKFKKRGQKRASQAQQLNQRFGAVFEM
jgi:hypothetical protein